MNKVIKNPGTDLFPVPAVLVTSRAGDGAPNIVTVAWTGIINSMPPLVYISLQPVRYSHRLIKESGEFVINLPTADLARQVDYCGTVSGRRVDKFKETGFTPLAASRVKAPLIGECPVNLECRVQQVLSLGSHDAFIAEVLAVHFDREALDDRGRPDFDRIRPLAYCMQEYLGVHGRLGSFGFSRKE